jgi:hypothetical protein
MDPLIEEEEASLRAADAELDRASTRGLGFIVYCLGFIVYCLGFIVYCVGFRLQGVWLRV